MAVMKSVVSHFLIVLLLVSQSLSAVAHSHAATSVDDSDRAGARPHVHLHGHAHGHDDRHEQPADETPFDCPDHDSDAVYVGDFVCVNAERAVEVGQAEELVTDSVGDVASIVAGTQTAGDGIYPQSLLRPRCARFLQLLSIRC